MNRILTKRQAICRVVFLFAACAVFALWPLRLFRETVRSASGREAMILSEAVNADWVVEQRFIAQYGRLKEIAIYLAERIEGDKLNFVLRDGAGKMLVQQVVDTGELKDVPGILRVPVGLDTEVGRDYYFLLQGVESAFRVAFVDNTGEDCNFYIGAVSYDGAEDVSRCMAADYVYEMPLRKGKTLLSALAILAVSLLVTAFSDYYYRRYPKRDRLVTVERVFRFCMNPLIAAGALAAGVAIWPFQVFTRDIYSILFYETGVIFAAGVLFYGVNHNRTGLATARGFLAVTRERWRDDLQSAMFAGALWGCCNYMNGLYDIHHTVAYRQVLIFLALSLLVTYSRRELLHLANLAWAALAAGLGPVYYSKALAALTEAAVAAGKGGPEDEAVLALKLTVAAAVLSGLVLINTVRILVKGQVGGISVPYALLVGAFFALLIWRRNTRGWPIYLVCAFCLIYLRMATGVKREKLPHNIVNGILFHFLATAGYCLLYRPYLYFRYYRYPFHFHTVTIAAVYLALVVCAALVKFLDAYGRKPCLAGVWREMTVFGLSFAYLVFTLSRTGYLAVAVMAIIVIPISLFMIKRFPLRQRWAHFLRGLSLMALSALLCFPIAFTAQRTIPALTAEIRTHEIEEFPPELYRERDADSPYYMTVERFIQVFQMKVLGIPQEKSLDAFLFFSRKDGAGAYRSPYLEKGEKILLASTVDMGAAMEEEPSFTNGRLYIFRQYYDRLNRAGHDDMGIMEPNGNYLAHAHNIYLQVAYDHGVLVGVVFLLLGAGTFVQALRYVGRHGEDRECALFPLALLILFAVAGLTEWIFHPCSPAGCFLLLALAPLLTDMR